ncbi:MAG: flagellar assembly lytic transglycosylase [Rectinemataceae bacterium]
MFAVAPFFLASCQEQLVFGMPESRFRAALASGDPSPIVAIDKAQLDQYGDYGPASYYYLARWIESRPSGPASAKGASIIAGTDAGSVSPSDSKLPSLDAASLRVRLLFRRAYELNGGLIRKEAGHELAELLRQDGEAGIPDAWEELAAFDEAYHISMGPDWTIDRSYLDALDGLGRSVELLGAIAELRAAFPAESAADADALLYYEGTAGQRLGHRGWAAPLRSILLERPTSDWTSKALDFIEALEPPAREFSVAERRVVRMRIDVAGRDYGVAYHEAVRAPGLIFTPRASPELVADAGKAFLYSGESRDGIGRFVALESEARQSAVALGDTAVTARAERVAWTAAFYRARFYRALQRWKEAAALFENLADEAPSPSDADAALWYGVECASKVPISRNRRLKAGDLQALERRALLGALEKASASWSDPGHFTDLVDSLFFDAMQARDWDIIEDLAGSKVSKTSPVLAARCAYVAARALELGLYPSTKTKSSRIRRGRSDFEAETLPRSLAGDTFRAIMNDPSAPLHYRALAAWRLGEEPSLLPPERAAPPDPAEVDPLENFLAGFVRFDLSDLVCPEAMNRLAALDGESLRRLSAFLAQSGRPDVSMRLIAALMGRSDWDPRRSDYELFYPRPFLSEIRSVHYRLNPPEAILFGLLRSESYFRTDAHSDAGAMGLAQLMPSTAAEIAHALDIESYDLNSPRDNLRFGIVYFSDLLAETGRPLRAMWAYNAGRGRLKQWLADSSDLPDDLKLEVLGIDETRQYGRNILQAAVMYGELYYKIPVETMTEEIIDGEPSWLQQGDSALSGP